LRPDEPVDAVEGDAAVVADDASAAVGVRQAGDDAGAARRLADLGSVGVEDAVVVGLAVLGEDLVDGGVGLVAVGLQCPLSRTMR
jgi:hypothetical protein